MSHPADKPATYDDLLAVPDHLVAELIHGQLHTTPRPAPHHALASTTLGAELVNPYGKGRGGPGGWWILIEPELHLGPHVLVPDLAGWRKTRMPSLPSSAWFETPPDWVCEILSPSTASLDRTQKMPLYAHYGVGHLWLVDPAVRILEAYELRQGRWTLLETLADDAEVSLPPFDATRFSLAELWA